MKQLRGKRQQVLAAERTDVAGRIVAFLRAKYPQKTAECVAADIGVSAETVSQWELRQSVPGGIAIGRMIIAYGPEFLCAYLASPPAWLSDAYRAQRMAELEARRMALEEEMRALSAK